MNSCVQCDNFTLSCTCGEPESRGNFKAIQTKSLTIWEPYMGDIKELLRDAFYSEKSIAHKNIALRKAYDYILSLEQEKRKGPCKPEKEWRFILGSEVTWHNIIPNNKAAWDIARRFSPLSQHSSETDKRCRWHGKTLGEVCDMGVREWQRQPGWGEKTTELFKSALRIIAKDPNNAQHYIGRDAFDPEVD